MNMFQDYEAFLGLFKEKGYTIEPLGAADPTEKGTLYLRHDIDFDVELALEMARAEAKLGINSSYFLMLSSDSYNLFSRKNAACVDEIKRLGHKASIHFDPLRYENFETGLCQEINTFETFFQLEVDLISLHRPNDFFLSYDQEINGVAHTYQSKYMKKIKYVSDSRGSFRFGAPEETEAFERGTSMHLLIHPIWWVMPSPSPQETLDAFTLRRLERFQYHIEANCLTYSRSASRISVED